MSTESTSNAYKYLRARILSGALPPGTALATKQLSKKMGMSRTPIHDALRQLETDGLVVIRPRQGATVKFMGLSEFKQACSVRQALECHAAVLAAANRTDAELEEIRSSLNAMNRLFTQFDRRADGEDYDREMENLDIQFHMSIMNAAKNDLLRNEIMRMHLIDRVVSGLRPMYTAAAAGAAERKKGTTKTIEEHSGIFRALEAKDGTTARTLMEAHIQDTIDRSVEKMRSDEAARITSEFGRV